MSELPGPDLTPDDLEKYEDKAIQVVMDLKPGESVKWTDAVRTAKVLSELEETGS